MNKIFLSLFILIFAISANALQSLKIANGQYLAFESYSAAGPEAPTLIMLPGINRALDSRDAVIKQMMRQKKFNFVTYHTSLHPESLKLIPQNEFAYFEKSDVSISDLANESLILVKKLKIKNPVFVSLSYSSVISSQLAKMNVTKLIIEVAPMIRFDESDPEGSQGAAFWKNWFSLFPGMGEIWANNFLKQAYARYWSVRVDEMLQEETNKDLRDLMIKAYSQLSIAADGFDYREQDFSNSPIRHFIVADKEDEVRADFQRDAIEIYQQAAQTENIVITVKDAGHIVPSEQPQQYIDALRKILKSEGLIK